MLAQIWLIAGNDKRSGISGRGRIEDDAKPNWFDFAL